MNKRNIHTLSAAGLLVALGIIYGDIGTSPLYVFSAVINGKIIDETLILGGLSCIIWTLTLQTTVKYVLLMLNADNKGEGGTFSLLTLVRRQKKWLIFPAMIGGAFLLSDGIITPPITVTSAIEGIRQIPGLETMRQSSVVSIVLTILSGLFFVQQLGTANIGRAFGPVMFVWFCMLAIMGIINIHHDYSVLKAFNPYYAARLLTQYPHGFWILGAIFLCTTGAEALYSDLGHAGKKNIRISWIFVKAALILNYMGQSAYLLTMKGKIFANTELLADKAFSSKFPAAEILENPFYQIMPEWFRIIGIVIATMAAIIASQAMLSGSFTLISEAIRLNVWPKMKIKYPSEEKGQVFIPGLNLLLWAGCVGVVLYFQKSSRMEAAYGLAITLCMITTTLLFAFYLIKKRVKKSLILLFLGVYGTIEISFLIANLEKFPHGGYVTLIIGGILFTIMYVWYRSRKIKNRYVEFVRLEHYIPMIQELSNDKTVARYTTHLVYMTSADNPKEIEHKIIYSILNRKPKRADIYWFVHVDTLDDPYTSEYTVEHIIPNDIIRVEFRLGFRVEQKIQAMMRRVVEDLIANKEVNITSRYESLERNNIAGDWHFIVMEKYLSTDNELPYFERLIMKLYFGIKKYSLSEERSFGLDPSYVHVEKFPLLVSTTRTIPLKRTYKNGEEV